MKYKVEVIFVNKNMPRMEDVFDSAYISHDSEVLLLFKETKDSPIFEIKRWDIPLKDILEVTIVPYEDNGQKVSSC